MAKYSKDEVKKAREWFADTKPGDTIYCKVTHVARSGMSRSIELYRVREGEIQSITWAVSRLLGESIDRNNGGVRVSGCGMDMCFHTVYNLGLVLFPDGFNTWPGYWRNDPMDHDPDGGYALKYRTL